MKGRGSVLNVWGRPLTMRPSSSMRTRRQSDPPIPIGGADIVVGGSPVEGLPVILWITMSVAIVLGREDPYVGVSQTRSSRSSGRSHYVCLETGDRPAPKPAPDRFQASPRMARRRRRRSRVELPADDDQDLSSAERDRFVGTLRREPSRIDAKTTRTGSTGIAANLSN